VAKPLRVGSRVLAGTILGHLAPSAAGGKPHLLFELRPAGVDQALVDPRPFLDAWTQLATLELHRNTLGEPLYGPDLENSDAGQAVLMSQIDLERVILSDGHLHIALCERKAIADGDVDRRVLASIEFLVDSGLDPTVSGAQCAAEESPAKGNNAAGSGGDSVAITAINSVPVAGHQGAGTTTDAAIRALLTLTGTAAPSQIASLDTVPGAASTVADLSDVNQIVISFTPQPTPLALASTASYTARFALGATRWAQLDEHLLTIPEPHVPTVISKLATRAVQQGSAAKLPKTSNGG
jgi:hypothetical protein